MNKALMTVLIIFAVVGFSIFWVRLVGFISDAYQEAKEKHKKIELGGLVISIVSVVISLFSLYFVLNETESLKDRIHVIENNIASISAEIKK